MILKFVRKYDIILWGDRMKRRYIAAAAAFLLLCGCTNIEYTLPSSGTSSVQTSGEINDEVSEEKHEDISEEKTEETSEEAVEAAVYTELTEEEIPVTSIEDTEAEDTVPDTTSVSIVCAGDNLIHAPIYRIAHRIADDGGYDFSPAYEHLGTLISDADLAILNQETIISDDFEPSTWPFFCTPADMARDMTELGFDAFSIANNHVLDKGEAGLISTLSFWRDTYPDIPVYGAYINEEDMNDIRTLTVNGVRFAFVGFMEHTNGLYLPSTSDCRITYLSDEAEMERQIRQAREIADCVIVSVHFGIEVTNTITDQQYKLSQKFADWGADIIIGTQPHTVQSMQYLDAADGRKAFVFYCLGNFISTMDNPLSMAEMLGCITVTRNAADGSITLSDARAVPLVDYYDPGYTYVGVYPLEEYTRELAKTHAVSGATYEFILRLFRENIPKEFMDDKYIDLIYG